MRRLRRLERAGRVLDNRGFRVPRPAGGRHLAQRGFGVVHGDQNGALTGQVALVGGRFGLAHQRLATPEIENRKTHLPLFHGLDAVGQNQFREIAGEQLDNPRQADVREQTCGLYADLSGRGVQLCFGDGDVRAAAQQAGRRAGRDGGDRKAIDLGRSVDQRGNLNKSVPATGRARPE